jgi:two-component system phosphate regulon sensor histidine kinase PhoR
VVLGAAIVWGVDSVCGRRFIDWSREPDTSAPPVLRGLWGEASYRTARALRAEQQKARDSAQRLTDFLAAIQASPNGVILLDPEGRIEWCNDIAGLHFGIHPQRDLLQHVSNLVREPAFTAYYAGRKYEREVNMFGRGGTASQPVKLSVQLHPYGSGHKLMLSRDITAIEQADRMRRDFVANVSHEIRTPLTVLSGFIETMQSVELSSEEQAHYLALMAQQAGRMQALVQDLLALSRLEGSPPPDLSERIVVRDLLAQSCANAQALSGVLANGEHPEHQVQADVQVDDSLCVLGSRTELESAFGNLLGNAVRYTPFGGTIIASARMLPEGGVRLEVRDSGPGIAREHLPRLTERFYRIDHSRSRETGGTGLGLAIVKHVAQRHGAELQITSDLGMGSCFALEFPAQRVCHVDAAPLHDRPILAAVE